MGLYAQSTPGLIESLQIFGERCSGTNYVEGLLRENLVFTDPISYPYGHKHFPLWYCLPESAFHAPSHLYNFDNSERCLIIVVFRNPYDWALSFYKNPHHVEKKFPFSNFIREPVRLNEEEELIQELLRENPFLDKNPETGQIFKNIFELRACKIKNMLEIRFRAKNVYYVQYESARDHPEELISELAQLYHLQRKEEFKQIIFYKNDADQGLYQAKKPSHMRIHDISCINSQLDLELEASIGYNLFLPN